MEMQLTYEPYVFSEGVGKSAVGAITLDSVLRERLPTDPKFSQTFFTRLANRTSGLWDVSKWLDYGRKSTVPCKNESLAQGAEFRWFNQKMDIVMARVSLRQACELSKLTGLLFV